MPEATDKEVEKVLETIYIGWGSSTGHLFGLRPEQRPIVKAIVAATIMTDRNLNSP